jgi:hypothetical protein
MKFVTFCLFVVVWVPLWAPYARADGGDGHGESHFVAPEDGALVVFVRRRFLQKKRWRRRYAAALAQGNEMRDTITDYADRFTVRPEDGRTQEEATELGRGD